MGSGFWFGPWKRAWGAGIKYHLVKSCSVCNKHWYSDDDWILYQNICPVSKQQTRLSSHFPISSYVSRKPFCPISYKFLNLVSISSPPPTLFSFHIFLHLSNLPLFSVWERNEIYAQNHFQPNWKDLEFYGIWYILVVTHIERRLKGTEGSKGCSSWKLVTEEYAHPLFRWCVMMW